MDLGNHIFAIHGAGCSARRAQGHMQDGAKAFVKSWNGLMDVIASKSAMLKMAV